MTDSRACTLTPPLSIHALDPGLDNFPLAILNTDIILKYAKKHFKSKGEKAGTYKKLPKKFQFYFMNSF